MATITDEASTPLAEQEGSSLLLTEGGTGNVSVTGVAAAALAACGAGSLVPPGTLVQVATPTFNTQSISFTNAITAGNSVIVCMSRNNGITAPITISGNGNTLTQAEISANNLTWIYYYSGVGASPGATISGASGAAVLYAYEVEGPITLDKIATASTNGGSATSTYTCSTATDTSTREFWVGVVYAISGPSSITGPATPWVNEATEANACVSGYQFTNVLGAATYSGTFGSNSTYEVCAATFAVATPSVNITGAAASATAAAPGGALSSSANVIGVAAPGIGQSSAGALGIGAKLTGAAASASAQGGQGVTYAGAVTSPALELYGFGAFAQITAGSVIVAVVASIGQYGSDAAIGPPSYQLWDGTTAQIGSTQNGQRVQNSAYIDEVSFAGVTLAQIPTLRLRVYASSQTGNSGAADSIDWASLTVAYNPPIPVAITGVAAAAVAAAGGGALGIGQHLTGAAASAIAAGSIGIVFGGKININVVGVGASVVAAGSAGSPGVGILGVGAAAGAAAGTGTPVGTTITAIAAAYTAGYASSNRTIAGGSGTWANPGNADGPPDQNPAVWGVP